MSKKVKVLWAFYGHYRYLLQWRRVLMETIGREPRWPPRLLKDGRVMMRVALTKEEYGRMTAVFADEGPTDQGRRQVRLTWGDYLDCEVF